MGGEVIRRLLPKDEWHRLAGTSLECLIPEVASDRARVLVVEHEGQIIGHLALLTMTHVHGLWVHPENQKKASVLRHLKQGLWALTEHDPTIWMGAAEDDETMHRLLRTLQAVEPPYTTYVLRRRTH